MPDAPADPRLAWSLPTLGALPTVEVLDELTTRVLAPNPSPVTLDGTNTYVLAARGGAAAVVVDPGPEDPSHLANVEEVVAQRDAEVGAIVLTHHHHDHAEAAASWAERWRVPVLAADPALASGGGRLLDDGARLSLGGLEVAVLATPGHTHDHVALRLGSGALLTGDHVLGRGTSLISYPDGDLAAYLASLRRVLDLGADALFPGHGPALTHDPAAVVRYYLDHRGYREQQLREVLAAGPTSLDELVAIVYAEVDRRLWPAAAASTRATLAMLQARGEVVTGADGRSRLA